MFTDYYAEASCTAGRASFITGEIPLRTGLTTVGQAGADVGMPDKAATIAAALKVAGYATGQFGKNHLGDLNKFLPTLHGFDEFFGYLYHLDAMSDPYWYSFPNDPVVPRQGRPAQSGAHLGDRHGRPDRAAALGQDRQAEDRRRGSSGALPRHVQRAEHARHHAQGQIRHDDVRRSAGQGVVRLHGQGQDRRQAVLRLAQHDAHARLDVPVAQVPGADEQPDQLRPRRGRHGATGRQRRRPPEMRRGYRARPTTPSSSSPPTTAPKSSPGPMAA